MVKFTEYNGMRSTDSFITKSLTSSRRNTSVEAISSGKWLFSQTYRSTPKPSFCRNNASQRQLQNLDLLLHEKNFSFRRYLQDATQHVKFEASLVYFNGSEELSYHFANSQERSKYKMRQGKSETSNSKKNMRRLTK